MGAVGEPIRAVEIVTRSAAGTRALGEQFGRWAPDGAVLLLEGELGAGKTVFAQGVAAGCDIAATISSPTFNLILEHFGRRAFVHADLYRIDSFDALRDVDIGRFLEPDGIACVEWPSLVVRLATPPLARIGIFAPAPDSDERRFEITLCGAAWGAFEPSTAS